MCGGGQRLCGGYSRGILHDLLDCKSTEDSPWELEGGRLILELLLGYPDKSCQVSTVILRRCCARCGARKARLTSINLHDVRNRQAHFVPINSRSSSLQRVPLEIHRLQMWLPAQLVLDVLKPVQLVVRRPELLQIRQGGQVLEPGDLVVRAVEDLQRGVALETRERGDGVVRHVQFFEACERRQSAE